MMRDSGNARLARWELPIVVTFMWLLLLSIPLSMGKLGLSWDALNHHIYLGWSAENNRFNKDLLAASLQSYQFPYLYWPVYKLAILGFDGVQAGMILATLQLAVVVPVWIIARTCMPGATTFDVVMRLLGVVLAFMTAVVLKLFESTSNDLLAAIPLVWAMALSLAAMGALPKRMNARQRVLMSGVLAGVSVAFKLSNGPLAIMLPILWATAPGGPKERAWLVLRGCLAAMLGFALAYGYWGTQLWLHFGNPIYPFADNIFAPLRNFLEWHP